MNIPVRLDEATAEQLIYLAEQFQVSRNKMVAICIQRTFNEYKANPKLEQMQSALREFQTKMESITGVSMEEFEQLSLFSNNCTKEG